MTRRRDATHNRERLLQAALHLFAERGLAVTIDDIATTAGVGAGTFYRNFETREDLYLVLEYRSYDLLLAIIAEAAGSDSDGIECVRRYLELTVQQRGQLFLPLRGGTVATDERARSKRRAISTSIRSLIDRGVDDGTLRAGLTESDLVIFATMLTHPLANLDDWDRHANRQIDIFIDGLRTGAVDATGRRSA